MVIHANETSQLGTLASFGFAQNGQHQSINKVSHILIYARVSTNKCSEPRLIGNNGANINLLIAH